MYEEEAYFSGLPASGRVVQAIIIFFLGATVFQGVIWTVLEHSSSNGGTCDYLKWILTAK